MWEESLSKMFNTCDHLLKRTFEIYLFMPFLLTQGHLYGAQTLYSQTNTVISSSAGETEQAVKAYSPRTREVIFLGPPTFWEHLVPPCVH